MFLCRHKLGPGYGFEKAAKYMKCATTTAKRWVVRYDETGDVVDEVGRGRPRLTTPKQDKKISAIVSKKRKISSKALCQQLENKGISISSRTVRRRLNESGFKSLPPLLKPLLTEKARFLRLQWAQANRERDWSNVIFTDETTVELFRSPTKVWRRKGEQVVYPKVKHPLKVHAWGCFSSQGFGELYCFTENLNGDLLCKLYEQALLPSAQTMFGEEKKDWILQEDNDPKHRSQKAENFRQDHKLQKIDWPSYSPDLNPIENVWSILKSNVAENRVTTLKGLIATMKKEWANLTLEYAQRLAETMSHRIEAVIQREGDFTMY